MKVTFLFLSEVTLKAKLNPVKPSQPGSYDKIYTVD